MLTLPGNIEQIEMRRPRLAFIIRKICEQYTQGKVIEVGCGNGRISQILGELGIEILGVDIDEEEIRKAVKTNTQENVQFVCMDIKDISEKFSGVVLTEVLEHIEEPLDFLQDSYRICEDDGFFILTIPNGYSLKERVMEIIRMLKQHAVLAAIITRYRKRIGRGEIFNESPHVQQFRLKTIRSLIEQAGFTIQEESYSDVWSGFVWMYLPWLPIPLFIKGFERSLTKYMPHYLLGDWGFLCLKKVGN